MENLPHKVNNDDIVVEINNANLLDSTWIIGGFLKELNNDNLESLTIQKTVKGDHSLTIIIIAHFFDSTIVNTINQFVNFLMHGQPYFDDLSTAYTLAAPIYRIAKYIAKRKSEHFSAKVNEKEILYPKMNKEARDRILSEDDEELRLDYDEK